MPTPDTPSLAQLRASIADRYSIGREIGRGGMATVYLAEDVKHGREVALKVLRPEIASSIGADRFLREIRVAARLNHPHIVPLHDSGELAADGGAPLLFYVMPYVRGESLRSRIAREGRLAVEDALRITRQVASALHHAHEQGLIHRDVKPENILLHEGEAMVTDFGIARATDPSSASLTEAGIVLGTAAYMSPEQAVGDSSIDARSDEYSLACVLYEMLAGTPPFTGATALATMTRRLFEAAPSVRRARVEVPAAVERALATALARDPAARFATCVSFAEALTMQEVKRSRARSVAVLPFISLSGDPENEYFADGITEDVIANLSKLRSLEVISRTSVMPFKKREVGLREIASRLQVASVVEGSVRRAGDRVRIVAQLIDAETDQHVWSETYDRQLTDIFAIQSDVALRIAAALRAELSPDEQSRIRREPTTDLKAYQLYLQGRHWFIRFTPAAMRQSIEYFEAAVKSDPRYALAHAAIALALIELAIVSALPSAEAFRRAKDNIDRALSLDRELGDAYTALGHIQYVSDFDWRGAEESFRQAIALNPGGADAYDLYGRMLAALERYDEAIAMLERAYELDPLAHRSDLVNALVRAGRYEQAIEIMTPVVELDPTYGRGWATLAWAYLLSGREAEGIAHLERALSVDDDPTWLAQLGAAYAMTGNSRAAREVIANLESRPGGYASPYHLAYVHTGLGDHDAALDLLEQAFEERAGSVYGIRSSFLFTPLRSNPRFARLLARMNLDDASLGR